MLIAIKNAKKKKETDEDCDPNNAQDPNCSPTALNSSAIDKQFENKTAITKTSDEELKDQGSHQQLIRKPRNSSTL